MNNLRVGSDKGIGLIPPEVKVVAIIPDTGDPNWDQVFWPRM